MVCGGRGSRRGRHHTVSETMNPKERFTSRVENYVKYRPGYPQELVTELRRAGLSDGARVVDVGSGTGISTDLFLRHGYAVTGVEPNEAMRAAALARGQAVVEGTAEATGLADGCADLVFCAQAFHWFRRQEARREFLRVARTGGLIAVAWNLRRTTGNEFVEGLEALLGAHSADYAERVKTDTSETVASLGELFAPAEVRMFQTEHGQRLDWPSLLGRLLSASYVPQGDAEFEAEAMALFDRTQRDGFVWMPYDCRMYWLRVG